MLIFLKIFSTIFMILQAIFLYGLTAKGFSPTIFDRIALISGFIAVFIAIWL